MIAPMNRLGRRVYLSLVLLIITAIFVAACGTTPAPSPSPTAPSQPTETPPSKVTLKVAEYLSPEHFASINFTQKWMARVKELEASIELTHFPAGQLGTGQDALDMTRDKVADINIIVPPFFASELPLTQVITLPQVFTAPATDSPMFAKLLREEPLVSEFRKHNMYPFSVMTTDAYEFYTKDLVRMPGDLKGMKIRGAGSTQLTTITAGGGIPVTVAPTEAYVAVQRGTIDGVFFPVTSGPAYALEEVTKFLTDGTYAAGGGFILAINNSVFEGLHAKQKAAILKAGEEVAASGGKFVADRVAQTHVTVKAKGVQVTVLTAAEKAAWSTTLKGVRDKWVSDNAAKGIPAGALLETVNKLQGR